MKFIHYEGLWSQESELQQTTTKTTTNRRVAISVVSLPDNDNVSLCNRIHALYKYQFNHRTTHNTRCNELFF